VLAAVGVAVFPALGASNYVVDNTVSCSDTGPGSSAQPFCTIAAAAAKAVAGDSVLVRAGTYAGTSVNPANSGTAGSPIRFSANPGVLISGGTRAFALSSDSYITISGFTITGTSQYGISVSGGSGVVLSNNTVTLAGHPVSGQIAAGISVSNLAGGRISGNVTHDNSDHGIYLAGSTTGVTVAGNTSYHNAEQYQRNANGINVTAPGNTIVGNVTYANEDSGINIYPGANNSVVAGNLTYGNGDHGIDDYNVTGGRITGNTVVGNCTDGINVEGTSGSYVIENNVAVNNATGAIINPTPISPPGAYTNNCNRRTGNIGVWDSAPATTTADYNLVWQTGAGDEYTWAGSAYATQAALFAATGQEAHGLFADPKFVNLAGANFQLAAGSPAIDSADSAATGEQTTDLLGHARVDDPATVNTGTGPRAYDDRGAYEYQPPTPPTAALSVTPATGTAPLGVTADASASTAGSAAITSYTFAFGDGTTVGPQPGKTATHTYTTPGSYTVTLTVTDANSLTSTATKQVSVSPPTGLLRVTTNPAVPSQITVDGQIADTWGLNWLKLTPGSHAVCFSAVQGYTSPACQTVSVTAGATTSVAGAFTQRGFLNVQTSPPVAATISVDGIPRDDWGLYTDFPAGSHQVCFGAVADFTAPGCQDVTVTAGGTLTVTGVYVSAPGTPGATGVGLLRVTTNPAVPSQITVDGQIADTWGLNWLKLTPGSHAVCFSAVQGYTTPGCQTVSLTAGATTLVTATFTQRGFLQVTTSPPVAGTISVDGVPSDDWGLFTDVPAGGHTVCFGSVPGYANTPACQPVSVTAGATTTIAGAYS
jgi:parallel beta-helix repeat protein